MATRGVTFPTHMAIGHPDLRKGLPFHAAGGKATQNGLPKTGVNCAHEKASRYPQSHGMCDSRLDTPWTPSWTHGIE